jgi:hemerythrin-like domain-containing protein
MENKPLKRSQYMVSISHDHHSGLLFCWKIKEGIARGVDLLRIKTYINFFWEHHLKEHFREEEALLFDNLNDKLTSQAKQEHTMLVDRINKINHEITTVQDYLSFAELMTRHIRFEERVLFPHLEAELPMATLIGVGAYLEKRHQTPFKDNYPDDFWVKKKIATN